ncbi:putative vitellogenin receptor yl isoform X1 [Rhodnius prolixus]|uniref:putative vitellogenin receptor yl isoform X1 n=1 Tax=Rhodnius prolixus TaxID=13249 RepID=UPI003D18773B
MGKSQVVTILASILLVAATKTEQESNKAECPSDHFLCRNGRCISSFFVCDGENDCGTDDFSDEQSCHQVTTRRPDDCRGMFRCLDRLCIPLEWACNGELDCLDGSDEHLGCKTDHHCEGFQCKSGHCLPLQWKCDGRKDCSDGSDEIGCPEETMSCELKNRRFQCKNESQCIPLADVCNRHADCTDGSDEGGKCFNSPCSNGTHNCSQACIPQPSGHKCTCFPGFEEVEGICRDIDECQMFGKCDQLCINTQGHYNCSCIKNYKYENNACRAQGGDEMLVFATVDEVRLYFIKAKQYAPVAKGMKNVVGVAYDGKYIYWTTVADGHEALMRSDVFGTQVEKLFTSGLGIPEDLAVDHLTGNIYLTDSFYKHIAVCDEHGYRCAILYSGCDQPRAIALHHAKGLMIWTDWGKLPVIMISGMDGSNPRILVTENIIWPNGIAVDHVTDRLYWADAKLRKIETMKIDGTDRRTILSSTIIPFALDIFEDTIYWSDWAKKGIMACNKFTGKNCEMIIKLQSHDIFGIHVYHPVTLVEGQNPCLWAKCSHLCLLAPSEKGIDYACKCPAGMELSTNKHNCTPLTKKTGLFVGGANKILQIEPTTFGNIPVKYLAENIVAKVGDLIFDSVSGRLIISDIERHTLIAYNLQSKQQETIASDGIGTIVGMDFDHIGNNLFWVDEELQTVEVMNLKTYARATLVRNFGTEIPMDIALNLEDGQMYLVVHKHGRPSIYQVAIDGVLESKIHLVNGIVAGPRVSLTYDDQLKRLFWTDSSGKISTTDKNGHDFHIFKELPKVSPINLAFAGSLVFWTTYGSSLLYFDSKFNQNTNKNIDLGAYSLGDVIKVTAYRPPLTNVSHDCFWNNGYCSAICLPKGRAKKCICQNGKHIGPDGHACVNTVACKLDEYKCTDGQCLPFSHRCDKKADCPGGEDEQDCEYIIHCQPGTHKCGDACLPNDKLCDENKCLNKQDCHPSAICLPNDFKCESGMCIPAEYKCDSKPDCDDASDEKQCSKKTCNPLLEFRCDSGSCIPALWACDGQMDCSDASDESTQCGESKICDHTELTCKNKHCVDTLLRCNGEDDCEDGTDEENCPTTTELPTTTVKPVECNSTTFQCTSSQVCLPADVRCNGTLECPKGEDEVECEGICPLNEFMCPSGKCIPNSWLCDQATDCEDGSDERNCTSSSSHIVLACEGFDCRDGSSCISWSKVCDSKRDCPDGTDEGGLCGKSCESAGCDDLCIDTPLGHKCDCSAGYRLSGDGRTCLDINECLFHFSCSHFCHNTIGSYRCACDEQYQLRNDRIRCKAKGGAMEFVYATKTDIRKKSQSLRQVKTIYKFDNLASTVGGLELDTVNNFVYWTTEMPGKLIKMSLDEEKRNLHYIADLKFPTKLAYDWLTGHVYLVEQHRNIKVCSFQEHKCANFYSSKSDIFIKAIAVDAMTRNIFWSETKTIPFRKSKTTIKKSDMSGNVINIIVSEDVGDVIDFAIDRIHHMIYWADKENNCIERATYNGTLRELIFLTKHQPRDIGVFEDYLYWLNTPQDVMGTPGNVDYVTKCGLYGSLYKMCENIRLLPMNSLGSIVRLRLLHPALQPSGKNSCFNENCDYLCVIGRKGPTCICPNGEVVKSGVQCSNATGMMNGGEKFIKETVVEKKKISGWLMAFFIFIGVAMTIGGIIYRVYWSPDDSVPAVMFQNNSKETLAQILTTSDHPHVEIAPGKHEYENPLHMPTQCDT